MNKYFFTITKHWCDIKLKKLNYVFFNVNVEKNFSKQFCSHCTIYLKLKTIISNYIINENISKLILCTRLTKKNWQLTKFFIQINETITNNQNMNIVNDKINETNELFAKFEQLKKIWYYQCTNISIQFFAFFVSFFSFTLLSIFVNLF